VAATLPGLDGVAGWRPAVWAMDNLEWARYKERLERCGSVIKIET